MDLAWGSLVKAEKFSGGGRGVGLAFMLMTGWREIGTGPSSFLFFSQTYLQNDTKALSVILPPCRSRLTLASMSSHYSTQLTNPSKIISRFSYQFIHLTT